MLPPDEDAPPLVDVPDDPDDAPPLLVDPPDDEVDDELLVSSLPPHAASAVAPAKINAARDTTGPRAVTTGENAGSSASQNGHAASLTRT